MACRTFNLDFCVVPVYFNDEKMSIFVYQHLVWRKKERKKKKGEKHSTFGTGLTELFGQRRRGDKQEVQCARWCVDGFLCG